MICTKCKVEKSEEEFSFKNIEKGRRRTVCKNCHRIVTAEERGYYRELFEK